MLDNQQKIRYLKQYRQLKQEFEESQERYLELKEKVISTPIQHLSDMPKGNSKRDKIGDSLALLEEVEAKKFKLLNKYIKIQNIIFNVEDTLERRLLRFRYVDGLSFESIAHELSYTWRHVHRIHSRALKNLQL